MLKLGGCSAGVHTLSGHSALSIPQLGVGTGMGVCGGGGPHCYVLLPPEQESWRKHREGLAEGLIPTGTRLKPPAVLGLKLPHAGDARSADASPRGPEMDLAISPHVIKRRRGGLLEQRDIVKAHQAHKIQSTPQARRKEWEFHTGK
ncbi:voltage-dependent R-type calcium channel subunit alpha-1E isoform X1 [Arapaima gigas]